MLRNLDKNHDWLFCHGIQDYVKEEKEIELDIITNILCWKNNCFYDLDRGIDWYNIIGNKNKQLAHQLTSLILNINGVVQINNINYNLTEDRRINVNISLDTIYKQNVSINKEI